MTPRRPHRKVRTVEADELIRQIQEAQTIEQTRSSLPLIYRFPKDFLPPEDQSEAAEVRQRYVLSNCATE